MLKRDVTLDAIRVFAVFSVISVHYFLHSGFYNTPVIGIRMFIMITIRQFFMICVPLFMILTGYLMSQKELNKKYYSGIKKTLSVYVLASIACILFKKFYLKENYGIKEAIFGILDFSGASYSWYIEMYIGLFLLIPFINLIYNGLKNKRQKLILLFTCLALTSIPQVINIFNFSDSSWWINPAVPGEYQKLMPNWWGGLYPLTYYFIGAYLKEYGLCLKRGMSSLILGMVTAAAGAFNYYRMYGGNFIWGSWTDYPSIIVVMMAVLVFNIFSKTQSLNSAPLFCKKLLKQLSDCALGAYLLSYIFDIMTYPYLSNSIICLSIILLLYL